MANNRLSNFFKSMFSGKENVHNTDINLVSPLSGKLISLSDVNDEVFSQGILGDGFAIIPNSGQLYAPADCQIFDIFDTKHAISLVCDNGAELLIHIGIDTVKLEGRPFFPKTHKGDYVKAGDLIMEFDINEINKEGYDIVTPIILSNCDKFHIYIQKFGDVSYGECIASINPKEV